MSPIIIALVLILIFNYIIFFIAYKQQSDHYTDFTYASSFFLAACYFFFSVGDYSWRKVFIFVMVGIWAIRLGFFLRSRVSSLGEDKRFEKIRPNFWRFFRFFTIQATAVWLVSLPFLIGFTKQMGSPNISVFEIIGGTMLVIGFLLETIADWQKNNFKNAEGNKNRFMNIGLFKKLRHPNYLGEILFWLGMFIFVSPWLSGWEWLSIISPIWIIFLLIFVSGIMRLEKIWKNKYAGNVEFQDYFKRSWRLIPYVY